MKKTLWMLLSAAVFPLVAGEITLDGKLDEPEWQQAKKYTGFSRFASDPKGQNVSAQTEFAFVCTKDKVYAGIKCYEPLMEKLRTATPTGIWYTDESQLDTVRKVYSQEEAKAGAKLAVAVEPLKNFFSAEAYHQKYLEKNPGGYCHIPARFYKEK